MKEDADEEIAKYDGLSSTPADPHMPSPLTHRFHERRKTAALESSFPFVKTTQSLLSLLAAGKWAVEQLKENKVPGDLGLVLKSRAKHHAIAALLDKPFVFQDEPLVVQ